ncbi:DNA-binding MarR family transcriptional regulator [Paenibacillus sp. 1182]|uniref:hypothetical protein n=1 Tax=Paenibacillus sp. 1182 TaxID=2806565 RepID=UPI001B731FD7|nr:hypothetical protein [Paenibacillus sp. 1182]MBP1312289.1 DNA-binding MarR family transcriptional regulator [Paenibacillus sp. 1182]
MDGWIKLHRKTLDNPVVCKDSDFLAVWMYLLMNATHKEQPAVFAGEKITLQPGQLITGRKKIAERFNIHESKVQRVLKMFENEQQIEQRTNNQNRLVSILSWSDYQTSEHQNEHLVNNERTTDEQPVNTNKNVKNIENVKNDKKKDSIPKIKFAEFVKLTQQEYDKLVLAHGEDRTKRMIEILDNYKGSKGKKYASDYRAILNWVVERVEEEEQKGGYRQAKPFTGGKAASSKHDADSQAQASQNGGAVANSGSDQQDRIRAEGDSERSTGAGSKYDMFVRR